MPYDEGYGSSSNVEALKLIGRMAQRGAESKNEEKLTRMKTLLESDKGGTFYPKTGETFYGKRPEDIEPTYEDKFLGIIPYKVERGGGYYMEGTNPEVNLPPESQAILNAVKSDYNKGKFGAGSFTSEFLKRSGESKLPVDKTSYSIVDRIGMQLQDQERIRKPAGDRQPREYSIQELAMSAQELLKNPNWKDTKKRASLFNQVINDYGYDKHDSKRLMDLTNKDPKELEYLAKATPTQKEITSAELNTMKSLKEEAGKSKWWGWIPLVKGIESEDERIAREQYQEMGKLFAEQHNVDMTPEEAKQNVDAVQEQIYSDIQSGKPIEQIKSEIAETGLNPNNYSYVAK
jgi:hypothetical protein